MTTRQAVSLLRQTMRLNQLQFAEKLGVTLTSVSRYENGREPSNIALKKLADIAEEAKLDHLRDVFAAKRRAAVIATIDNLPSAGTQRRVSVDDLKEWHNVARETFTALQLMGRRPWVVHEANLCILVMQKQKILAEAIEVYIHSK